MAVETVAELYYQLGLDTAKLDKGFIDAQKTVNQNIRIMNRQEALIKLRADVQIQGLDESIDLTDALKIRQEELAQRLELTKDRVELTSAAYEQMKQSQGENAEASQLLAIQLEKERLVMAKLERQTRELNKQQKIAIDVQWEMFGVLEPIWKGMDALYAAGRAIGSLSLGQAQVAAAIATTLGAIAIGTKKASDELEEENLAKLLDNEFAQAQVNVANSLDTINQQTLQTSRRMNQAFLYGAQREITNGDYISDFLRLESILTDNSDSLSQALQKISSNTIYMNTELGKTIGLALGIAKSFWALKESAEQWATPALEGFRDLQKKAQEMKIQLPVANDIVNAINLAQGDYNDVRDWVRGVQDAIIKGDALDPEALALEKYNVVIQDARGNLLPFNETLENLYQGFLKAKEAGEEEAYIIMTNGQAVHDVLPFLENYGEAKQKINDIQWSTSDYDSLSKLSQNMKLAEIQSNEFKTALSSLAIPLANYSAEDDFKIFKTLTEIIEENRDTILYWEFAFIEALKKAESLAGDAVDSIVEKFKELKDSETLKSVIDIIKTITSPEQMILDIPFTIINSLTDSNSETEILKQAKKDLDEYNSANEKARAETQKTQKKITDGLSYSWNRIKQYEDEIADIQIELKFGDNEYEKELAKLDQWRDKALRNAKYYSAEQDIIEQEYWLKREQVQKSKAKAIEDLNRETAAIQFEGTHSAYQKEIYEIEQWKQKALENLGEYKNAIGDKNTWIEESAAIVANAAAKEAKAFESEMDRIRDKTLTLQEKVFNMTHSEQDRDIYNLQKELDQLAREGIYSPLLLGQYANLGYAQIQQKAKNSKDYSKAPNIPLAQGVQVNFDGKGLMEVLTPYQDFYGEVQAELQNYLMLNEMALKEQQAALSNFKTDFSEIGKHGDFSEMTQQLTELTQAAGAIAQEVTQKQQSRDINVNIGGISINLAGGYVFDNDMKARLTDDITSEVANAVKSAVEQGISQTSYSYAN